MIEKPITLDEAITQLAGEMDSYRGLLASPGWKALDMEIAKRVEEQREFCASSCDKYEDLRFAQGQIAAYRWIPEHFDEVAKELDRLLALQKEQEASETEAKE